MATFAPPAAATSQLDAAFDRLTPQGRGDILRPGDEMYEVARHPAPVVCAGDVVARAAGDPWLMAMTLANLGVLAHHQRENARAQASPAPVRAFDSNWFVSLSLAYPGLIAQVIGEAERAAELFGESLALCRDRDPHQPAPRSLEGVAAVAVSRGRRAPAAGNGAAPWSLTPRGVEVLRLLAVGHADRDIAAALFISHRTVHHHVAKVYAKLGVNRRTAAAHLARGAGLVDERSAPPQ